MESEVYWEAVCGPMPFWDYDMVWNTTTPDLPDCFQQTVLSWFPCAYLWLLTPFKLYCLFKSTYRCLPWTVLNIAKIFLCLVLCLLDVAVLSTPGEWSLSDYTAIFRFATLDLALVLTYLDKCFGVISSPILSVFWILMCILNSFTFASNLIFFPMDETTYIFNMIRFPLLFSQMMLSVLADSPPLDAIAPSKVEYLTEAEKSSYISNIFLFWYDRLALIGFRRTIKVPELGELPMEMTTNAVSLRFDQKLESVINKSKNVKRKKNNDPTLVPLLTTESVTSIPKTKKYLFKTLLSEFGSKFLLVMLFKTLGDCVSYLSPLILDLLIKFIPSGEPTWHGVIFTCLLGLATYMEAIFASHTVITANIIALKVRSSLMSFVYRKALKLSATSKSETTVGQIVNLMAVDVMKISNCIEMVAYAFALPIQISIAIAEMWLYVGPSSLVCLAFILIFQSISIYVARVSQRAQFVYMRLKDKRIKLMNQVLNGVKVLKLYAWEKPFSDYVNKFRMKELQQLKLIGYLSSFNTVLWGSSTITVSLSLFAVYVFVSDENVMNPSTAFVTLTIFNIIRRPLFIVPNIIASLIEARVSFSRLNDFSWKDELKPDDVKIDPNHECAVEINDASFSWIDDKNVCLKNINLKVYPGQLLVIVGTVGCGKSSFISAILGEMIKTKGQVIRQNIAVGYTPQLPWIQNATLKDNILFGNEYDAKRYRKVLYSCALESDLEILTAGDQTEIGEKGINLSGGQKQRVSLARTVYADASVYCLDDTLSAVDNHVGKHIFEKVIGPNGILKTKTRIFVTNSLVYASQADNIIVLSEGTITESGTYDELCNKKGRFSELVETFSVNGKGNKSEIDEGLSTAEDSMEKSQEKLAYSRENSRQEHGKEVSKGQQNGGVSGGPPAKGGLIQSEMMAVGKISYKVYWAYIKSYGYHSIFVVFGLLVAYGFFASSSIWLSKWSNDKATGDPVLDKKQRDLRLGVYGALGAGFVLFTVVWMISVLLGALKASASFHWDMLCTVFRAPQWFFDTTPTGRILNRFSSDIDTIDMPLPGMLRPLLNFAAQTLAGLIVIVMEIPYFGLIAVPVLVLFYYVQKFYIGSGRQLRRFESTTRSPIYSIFSESISGISTIRAFRVEQMFYKSLTKNIDKNMNCSYLTVAAQQWLSLRLELLGSLLLLVAGFFAVFQKDMFTPSVVALVMSYTISTIANFKILFRSVSIVETNMVSVERCMSYMSSEVPQEADWESSNTPPVDWPQSGAISFVDYKTKYREELDNVLRGVSIDIRAGEKIGIAGRTGAGKSSMTLALFRIIEASGGAIIIDGLNISSMGLHELRSRMTIIPQDPVLFSGPLRFNLDPFDTCSDEQIWTALHMAHLKSYISQLSGGLMYEVSEGGENFSVGQRQLICLARALLRRSQILVLDEATAAVDLETDSIIQKIVRQVFAHCTIVTIAHRLNTIFDYDRIVVLDKGVVQECGSVEALKADPNSTFYKLAKEEGLV